jgi:hypothetical protein
MQYRFRPKGLKPLRMMSRTSGGSDPKELLAGSDLIKDTLVNT